MTREQLLAGLKPSFPIICDLIRAATNEFDSFSIPADRRPVVDRGATGILIYCLIWDHFERHFGFEGPIRVTMDDGLKVLLFEELGIYVRVNKLNPVNFSGPVSRSPGKINLHRQMAFAFLEEPPGHLIFGYTARVNEQGVAVLDRILLTLEGEDGVEWSTYIDDDDTTNTFAEATPRSTPPVVRPKAPLEKPKRGKDEVEAG